MSLHSQPRARITCDEFEASFDRYVDDQLDPVMTEACALHAAMCPPCDREVTRWQQTRILLSTAVADFSTAVDVSSVRDDVFAALGMDADAGESRLRSETREAAHERGLDARRRGGRAARRAASSSRRGGLAAAWRFASAATVSAATAAAAVLLLTPAEKTPGTGGGNVVASVVASPAVQEAVRTVDFRPWSKGMFEDVARASYSPPPLAQPKVSHVDGLEAAPGQLVSTWVQPRTNARVIWVQDRGVGAPVRTAGLEK